MATVVKDFKIKSGLVVEGTTGTINNFDILTKKQADQDYIIGLIGGSATPDATPDTVVLRDENADFAANDVTVNELSIGEIGRIYDDGDLIIENIDGMDVQINAEDIRLNATDDIRLNATGDVVIGSTTGHIRFEDGPVHIGFPVTAENEVATKEYADGAAGAVQDNLDTHSSETTGVHGVTGNVVGTSDTQTLTNKTLGTGTNLSVALDMNGNKIEDLGTPTAGTDATTKNYVDDADTATLGSANSYTDGEISDLDSSLRTYADQAETDAKAYTDTRETAITSAYQTYADNAAADALADAEDYADQAELDAIDAAATAAAALYAPLAGATFTGDVLLPGDPTQALGAATKQYVDAVAEGLHIHASAVAATTTNVNLATGGLLLVDNVQLVADNRVLVKNQNTPSENGIYLAKAGAWVRASDYNSAAEIQGGDFTFVTGGDTYGNTGWVQTNIVTTLGTDPIEFDQFSGAGEYTAGTGLELNGTSFSIDETYTATKSYVDDEIADLDASLKTYADQAETDAKAYTDTRETAITTAYEAYADQAEADAKTYADGVALTAENNAKAYTDTREGAITTAYQNYADLAEADAKLYTDDEIAALDTDDIEEGTNNLYFTNQRAIDAVGGTIGDQIDLLDTDDIEEGATNLYFTDSRAKDAAADLIVNATKTNITITGTGAGLTITAENGVADSTTDDLEEGEDNLYFTDERVIDAVDNAVINPQAVEVNMVARQVASTLEAATAGIQVGHSFAKADYRSAEFLVKVAYGTHTEISKVLLTLDTSDNIAITEYGIVGTNGSASSISADVSGDNVRLLVTTSNNNSTVTVMGTLLV
jgi:hypothetical protein